MGSFVEFTNDCGKMFIDSTGSMLIQSSLLIAIVFGLDLLLRRRIRAVFRYCVWMLVLVKLVLPSNLSLPFSMGYWLGNAFDCVESSLPDAANPQNIRTQVVSESSSRPTEIIFDNPAQQILATAQDTDSLSTPNSVRSTYSTEAPTTNDHIRASAVKTKPTTNNMVVPPPQEVDLARDRAIALTWQALLFGLWLVVCMTTGLLVLQKTLLIQRLVRQAPRANKHLVGLFESCRQRILVGRGVGLRVSPIIPTPAVYGFFRPTVLIPERMLWHDLGTNELETIFIHELMHIQRSDLWVKLLQTILQVVYFYNPLLWLANATIRRVRELAVDEAVLVILGESTSEVYPRALLKVAGWAIDQPKHGLGLIGVMESNDLLKERINAMLHKPIPHSKKIGMTGLVTLFILGVFLLPMSRAEPALSAAESPDMQANVADSKAAIREDVQKIDKIKGEIESLRKAIQARIDELQRKELELQQLRDGLNAKLYPNAVVEQAPQSAVLAMGAVANEEKAGAMSSARTPGAAGVSGSQPITPGAPVTAALTLGPVPGAAASALTPRTTASAGSRPITPGTPMMAAVTGGEALSTDISEEVRKELQRILPEVLREILPKLIEELGNKN